MVVHVAHLDIRETTEVWLASRRRIQSFYTFNSWLKEGIWVATAACCGGLRKVLGDEILILCRYPNPTSFAFELSSVTVMGVTGLGMLKLLPLIVTLGSKIVRPNALEGFKALHQKSRLP